MIWLIADPHFGHDNIIEYASRPFRDGAHMNGTLVSRWQNAVKPGDLVYVLGDFMLGHVEYCRHLLEHLHGTKILIHGNHDRGHRAMETYGFAACMKSAVVRLEGIDVLLQHRPLYGELPEGVQGVFHGHIHRGRLGDLIKAAEGADIPLYNVNMCVEMWNYSPVSAKTAIKKLRRQLNDQSKKA